MLKLLQVVLLACPHSALRGFGLVVVVHKVQYTVDDIQQEFLLRIVAVFSSLTNRGISADDDFALEPAFAVFQGKRQAIGGVIVVEKPFIQGMNRRVRDKRQRDFGFAAALALQHGTDGTADDRII